MRKLAIILIGLLLVACGSSMPAPTDRLASAEAASRSAKELGANNEPKAALHLKLASDQIDQAKKLIADGDNKRADLVLQRANADAELAVMLAKEHNAKTEADKAQQNVKKIKEGK
ncbi:MAG: DUF4398 domain-containing protein [Labilithrix sp.]|nr:DUF4398 domain-containing protein [Labilithrix sp.]MCW5810354.1 DUF4398 domain-containing protein [Labilithrix sp.]